MKTHNFLYNSIKENCGRAWNNKGMKISEALSIIKTEKAFRKTPIGRTLTEYAIEAIDAALEDTKNYDVEATKCLNCGFLGSSLLFPRGCPNCNSKDISSEVKY